MGTRYEDQPPEHWAGPESLDPTPVWKQYLLIGLLLLGSIVLIVVVSLFALGPQLATPPALVPGERLVLRPGDVPALGAPPKRIGPPLVDDAHAFWLARVSRTEVVALRAWWSVSGQPECPVELDTSGATGPGGSAPLFTTLCGDMNAIPLFDRSGAPVMGARRGLDRYLVSVGDDRVIVNLGRLIVSDERRPAP